MKLLLLAFVAVAAAEPDSFWPYTTTSTAGVYNTAWNSGLYQPQVYSSNLYNPYVSSVYNQGPYRTFGKRDADADAFFPYTNMYNAAYQPQIYQSAAVYQPYAARFNSEPVLKQGTFHTNLRNAVKGIHTAPVGQVYQSNFASINKREADSESFYPGYPYTTTAGVYGAGLYNPTVYSTAGVYGNYQYPVASSVYSNAYNTYRLGKREADSDSDSFYPSVLNAGVYNYQYPTRAVYSSGYQYPSVYNTAGLYNTAAYNGLRYW